VYRKCINTNLYLNNRAHHYPHNKKAVLSILLCRARALCNKDSLKEEWVFFRDVFRQMVTTIMDSQCPQLSPKYQ
jgi:hypothetical protein